MNRTFPTFLCLSVFAWRIICPLTAADSLSEEEVEGILGQLAVIEDEHNGNRVSLRTSAVRAFETAAASDKAAYEFYLQCHKELKFDAKDASFSDFRAWRERNEERIKSKSNLSALRLQLQYLVLTMKAAEGVDRETLVPELESFVANIVSHSKDLERSGMTTLEESVKTSIFAEAYKLNKSLEVSNWCFEPGNFGDVYAKTIFPFMRSEHPESLADAWDRRISLSKDFVMITQEENQFELDKFQTERLPELNWQKASDLYQNYSSKQGAQSMLTLLRGNPSHTSLKNWLDQFRELLATSSSATPEAPPANTAPSVNNEGPLSFE